MRKRIIFCIVAVLLSSLGAFIPASFAQTQTVTLVPPRDPATGKYDEGKACFSFKYGLVKKEAPQGAYELGYGFLRLSDEDWFVLNHISDDRRTVISDLGAHAWEDSLEVPVLTPLPEIMPGERRQFIISTTPPSADPKQPKPPETTPRITAKVVTGHIYLVHVVDHVDDFYVMFRVDDFQQNSFCTITWKLVPAPASKE